MITNTSLRYWPDAITPIFNGTASTEYDDFHSRADLMIKFRQRSGEPLPAELTNKQNLEKSIKEFYIYYCLITQIVEVADRVILLANSRFMENISIFKDVFDEDEKMYLNGCSLPAAMKATPGGVKILSNQEANKWIKSYYFA
ncbi:MAG: hypothetical protein Q8K60_02965, partial [Parachlamydiaceae bacterium]|nr:hypothetical protein [Parachlamydiaceae bacterium]